MCQCAGTSRTDSSGMFDPRRMHYLRPQHLGPGPYHGPAPRAWIAGYRAVHGDGDCAARGVLEPLVVPVAIAEWDVFPVVRRDMPGQASLPTWPHCDANHRAVRWLQQPDWLHRRERHCVQQDTPVYDDVAAEQRHIQEWLQHTGEWRPNEHAAWLLLGISVWPWAFGLRRLGCVPEFQHCHAVFIVDANAQCDAQRNGHTSCCVDTVRHVCSRLPAIAGSLEYDHLTMHSCRGQWYPDPRQRDGLQRFNHRLHDVASSVHWLPKLRVYKMDTASCLQSGERLRSTEQLGHERRVPWREAHTC